MRARHRWGIPDDERLVIAATVGLFGVHDHWTGGYVWTAAISEVVAVAAALAAAWREGFLSVRIPQRQHGVRGVPQH